MKRKIIIGAIIAGVLTLGAIIIRRKCICGGY